MRVYFVESGLKGCYTVRCLLPLVANGWDGDLTSLNQDAITPENKAQAAQHADVIVFHRPDDPKKLEMARLLRGIGKKIVFDNDDTFLDDGGFRFNEFIDKERAEKGLAKINHTINTFIEEADLVTCSTEFLKKEYEKLNKNVIVLPNCVDPFYFDEPLKNYNGKVRIGIVGSLGITSDMDLIEPIVQKYHNDPRVEIVLFSLPPKNQDKITRELYSGEYKFWESVNVEWQSFVDMKDYYDTLNGLKLDLAIIPRADNYFNRCKSNLKFLEMSMFEIPCMVSCFDDGNSPYEVDKEDIKHMIPIRRPKDWIPMLEIWLSEAGKKTMKEMGKKAKKYVEKKYSIDNNAHLWEEAYKTLYE